MCSSLKFIQGDLEASNAESVLYYAKKVYEILQVDLSIESRCKIFIVNLACVNASSQSD